MTGGIGMSPSSVLGISTNILGKLFRQNAAKWNALTSEQREAYLRENSVMNNKR